jgi:uncharacterized protein
MTPEERQLLSALADRVRNVPDQQKDPEAEQLLRDLVRQRPDTVYVLAQTVIMQDFALQNAQAQIEDLQRQAAPPPQQSGGFLGGLFGRSSPSPQPPSGSVPRVNPWGGGRQDTPPPGYGNQGYGYPQQAGPATQQPQSGGFLRSAATTAVGVAGGALLFQGVSSMFGGGSALAGTHPTGGLTENSGQRDDYGGVQEADYSGGDMDFGGDDDYA